MPSAFPPPCPHKVIGSSIFFDLFRHLFFSVFVVLGIVFKRCWCHFGVVLVSFWCPWLSFGNPQGSQVEKVTKKSVRGSFVVPPLAPRFEPKSTKSREQVVPKSTLEHTARKVLHKRCFGTPSNHEDKGFVDTKPLFSHFHLELQNNRKWCPKGTLWDAFAWFWEVLGTILGHEK